MIHSMTAFARVQNQLGTSSLCWELKSVNHRYLDVSFRLPESFRFIENNLRNALRGQLSRGKLECHLKVDENLSPNQTLQINEELVNALLLAGAKLATKEQLANDLTVSHLLTWPGVIRATQPESEVLIPHVEVLFQQALLQLVDMRATEGSVLKEQVKLRLDLLKQEVSSARTQVELVVTQRREKLLSRLSQLQLDVVESRIDQEIALLLARLDVSEELDRLDAHMNEVDRALEQDDVAGRRLDFLMQELNREANTLSSKSDSVMLSQHAVQMKVLIEQMREQIQNIE